MKIHSKDSFKSLKELKVDNKVYKIFSLKEAEKSELQGISKLPKSLKILLEIFYGLKTARQLKKIKFELLKSG